MHPPHWFKLSPPFTLFDLRIIELHPSLYLRPILTLARDGLSEATEDGAQVHAALGGITAEEIDCKQNRID